MRLRFDQSCLASCLLPVGSFQLGLELVDLIGLELLEIGGENLGVLFEQFANGALVRLNLDNIDDLGLWQVLLGRQLDARVLGVLSEIVA